MVDIVINTLYTCHVHIMHVHTPVHVHTSHEHIMHVHILVDVIYVHIHIRAGKKVQIFEPSFVYCAFEAKFLPSKLRCHAHFNVCTCTLCNLNVWLKLWVCPRKVEAELLAVSA